MGNISQIMCLNRFHTCSFPLIFSVTAISSARDNKQPIFKPGETPNRFKKQEFNSEELAMLFTAFGKKLFIRPKKDEIYSIDHLNDDGCTFYFRTSYYKKLSADLIDAYEQGKFAISNANNEWTNLMNRFLHSTPIDEIELENKKDYFEEVGKFWM